MAVELSNLKANYLYYEGRSQGTQHRDIMRARNIAPVGVKPDWRVSQIEFTRWLEQKRFRVYERARYS